MIDLDLTRSPGLHRSGCGRRVCIRSLDGRQRPDPVATAGSARLRRACSAQL